MALYRDHVLKDTPTIVLPLDELRGAVADITGRHAAVSPGAGVYGTLPGPLVYEPYSRAFTLPGAVNGYIPLGNPADLQLANGTLEIWVKTTAAGAGFRGLIGKNQAWTLYLLDNVLIAYDWGGAANRSTGINVADGVWHHVAMSFQSGVASGTIIYLDGVPRLTTTITVNAQNQFASIGSGDGGGTLQNLAATVGWAAIYPTVLTAARILAHFNAGAGNPVDRRAADWRFTVTDRLGVILPDGNITRITRGAALSYRVSVPAQLSFRVPSDHRKVKTIHTDGKPMICKGRRFVRGYRSEEQTDGSWRYVLRYSGRVWTVQHVGDDTGVQTMVTCIDPRVALRRRFPIDDRKPLVTSFQVAYLDEEGGRVLQNLVDRTNAYDGYSGIDTGHALYRTRILAHAGAGLAAYWRLDDDTSGSSSATALDSSGNGNHALKVGDFGPLGAQFVKGAIVGDANRGASLDGQTNFLQYDPVNAHPGLRVGDTFTLEIWLRPALPLPPAAGKYVWDRGFSAGQNGYRVIYTSTGAIQLAQATGAATHNVIATSTVTIAPDGYWHHVMVTKAGATTKIYIDGADVTGAVTNFTIGEPTVTGSVGANRGGNANFFNGSIDEPALYTAALTAADAAAHNRSGKGLLEPGVPNAIEASAVRMGILRYDRRDLASISYELATAANGFDMDAIPVERTDGIHAYLDIRARQGVDRPNAEFDYLIGRHNVRRLEWLDSMEKYCNTLNAVGGIPDGAQERITASAASAGEITAQGVLRDLSIYSDLTNQGLLTDLTTEELAFRLASGELVQWVPAPFRHPRPFDEFGLGDTVRLAVGADLAGGFQGVQRVYGYDLLLDDERRELLSGVYASQT